MEQESNTVSLRELLIVLFKHKHKILTAFLSTVIVVTIGSFLVTPMYEAESSLMIKFGREYSYSPEVGEARNTISFGQAEIINSEIQILTSKEIVERVISTLGIENIYPQLIETHSKKIPPLEAAIVKFKKELSVQIVDKSNVINVLYQHENPEIASRAINLLVEFFKEKRLRVHSGTKSSFLEKQVQYYNSKLKESENSLESFKQKYRVFSLGEQRSLLLKQRTAMDTSLKSTQNRINEFQQRISSVKNQMRVISENVPLYTETERYKIIDESKAKLLNLQLREQELLGKYKESNRTVVNIRKEIQLVKDFLNEQEEGLKGRVRTGKNIVYQEMEIELGKAKSELSAFEAKSEAIEKQLVNLDNEIKNLDLRERELLNLRREVTTNARNYETYLAKSEEARISEDMDRQKIANIAVIQEATVPIKPNTPHKGLNIAFGIILGIIFSLGLALLYEYFSQGLSTPEKAEKLLALPVLVTVPLKK